MSTGTKEMERETSKRSYKSPDSNGGSEIKLVSLSKKNARQDN